MILFIADNFPSAFRNRVTSEELAARLLEESNDLGWSEAEFYEKEPWAKGL